jgi:hypothetical protein
MTITKEEVDKINVELYEIWNDKNISINYREDGIYDENYLTNGKLDKEKIKQIVHWHMNDIARNF